MKKTGTKNDPCLFSTTDHLQSLANHLATSSSKYVTLSRDIDLGGVERTSIGPEVMMATTTNVIFEGNDPISNFKIISVNSEDTNVYGFFGFVNGYIAD